MTRQLTRRLALEWSDLLERLHAGSQARMPANPYLYDPSCGLGVLARVVLLREVFYDEVCREHVACGQQPPAREPWLLNIERPFHAEVLFKASTLSASPEAWQEARHAIPLLQDPAWRQALCEGFTCAGNAVRGLNHWFDDEYEHRLPDGKVTPEMVFDTRFFGSTAIDNFVSFVRTGQHRPGVNRSMLDRQFRADGRLSGRHRYRLDELEASDAASVRRIVDTLTAPNNDGRPLVAVTCVGAPRHLTRIIDLVLQQLKGDKSVCYVPIHRQIDDFGAEAGGFDSIVEILHRFAQGRFDLEGGASATDRDLRRKLDEIRAFCARVPTVFVLDGYRHSPGPYAAIADFVADEPVTRLLRQLLHPNPGAGFPSSVRPFAGTFLLVVGDEVPAWARTQLHAEYRFSFDGRLKREFAGTVVEDAQAAEAESRAATRPAARETQEQRELRERRRQLLHRVAREATFDFAENYFEAFAYMVCNVDDVSPLEPYATAGDLHERVFDAWWEGLGQSQPWVRVFLSALAISHTGLREGSAGQLLDTFVKHFCGRDSVHGDFRAVSVETFRAFVNGARANGAGILNEFPGASEDRLADQTGHAAQTFSAWTDGHLWAAPEAPRAFALRSRRFRRQVLRRTARADTVAIARLLAEICLQSYRMLCVGLPPAARRESRARRWLTEVVYYGMNSLELDRQGPPGAAPVRRVLPRFTLGEIPSHPVSAYGFLYYAIFKDLLCDGNIASIGRESGNGELELDLLLFCGNPSLGAGERDGLPATSAKRRWTSPIVQRLLTQSDAADGNARIAGTRRAQDAVVQHLLEYCRAARRASRPDLLGQGLAAIRANFGMPSLSDAQRLAILKFRIDHEMLCGGASRHGRLHRLVMHGAAAVAVAHGCERGAARRIQRAVATLAAKAARVMEGVVKGDARIAVTELDEIVEEAFGALDETIAVEALAPDAIALLARYAILAATEALAAIDALEWTTESLDSHAWAPATRCAGSALCAFWLLKIVGARRQTRHPTAAPARVGSQVAETYVRLIGGLKTLLRRLRSFDAPATKTKTDWLERRLQRTGRSTLDTFLREQGGDHADHIVALILESKFVRHFGARAARLVRLHDPTAVTRDLRLAPLLSAYVWLHQAEREMLDFTARPSMRVLFCDERVRLCVEILDRAALDAADPAAITMRPVPPAQSRRLYPFLDLIARDLMQLAAYRESVRDDPARSALHEEWRRTREDCRQLVAKALATWFDDSGSSGYDAPWNEAVRQAQLAIEN